MNIKVKTKDGTYNVPSSGKSSILEALEIAKIECHAHCREGFCGACRTKISSGDYVYFIDPLAWCDDDELLICCSRQLTDIEVEVN